MACILGRDDDALRFAQRALDVAPPQSEELALSTMATGAWYAGDTDRAEAIISGLLETKATTMVAAHARSLLCYLATVDAFAGRTQRAEAGLANIHGSDGLGVWRGDDAELRARVLVAICLGNGRDAVHILQDVADSRPLDSIEARQFFCRWPAISYVLLPETRECWDPAPPLWQTRSDGAIRSVSPPRKLWYEPGRTSRSISTPTNSPWRCFARPSPPVGLPNWPWRSPPAARWTPPTRSSRSTDRPSGCRSSTSLKVPTKARPTRPTPSPPASSSRRPQS